MAAHTVEVELKDVRRTFTMGEVEVKVLRGINLELRAGELTAVLGPSGSGKSTLLNIIGGIDRPTSGAVEFDGRDIGRLDERALTRFRRDHVGFVFQFYNLVPTLTARENVQVSTEVADHPMDATEALTHVGLGDRLDHFPAQMSGGQQQRVAIARALAKNPRLMLCDEPTGALDRESSIMVLDLIRDLNERLGATIVMITHAPSIAEMARRVIRIDDGVVAEVKDNPHPITADEIKW